MSYMTISSQENTIFHFVHAFMHIRQHYFSKYWGTIAWAVPHLKFGGTVSPSPPRSPPLLVTPIIINSISDVTLDAIPVIYTRSAVIQKQNVHLTLEFLQMISFVLDNFSNED